MGLPESWEKPWWERWDWLGDRGLQWIMDLFEKARVEAGQQADRHEGFCWDTSIHWDYWPAQREPLAPRDRT